MCNGAAAAWIWISESSSRRMNHDLPFCQSFFLWRPLIFCMPCLIRLSLISFLSGTTNFAVSFCRFVVNLRGGHLEYWAPHSTRVSDTHPRERNSKCQSSMVCPPYKMALVTHLPCILPRYMFLDLPHNIICTGKLQSLCPHSTIVIAVVVVTCKLKQ